MVLHAYTKMFSVICMGAFVADSRRLSHESRQSLLSHTGGPSRSGARRQNVPSNKATTFGNHRRNEMGLGRGLTGGVLSIGGPRKRGDKFVCPRACKECCMSPDSGFHFECYFKTLFVARADMFTELAGYSCNRSQDMKNDGGVFTVCALGDDSYPGEIQDKLKKVDSEILMLDKTLVNLRSELEKAKADPLQEKIDKTISEIEDLRKAKDGSSKIFTDLKDQIAALEKALLQGAIETPEDSAAALLQTDAAAHTCLAVDDAGARLIQQKTDLVETKKKQIAEKEEEVEKAQSVQRSASTAAKKKLREVNAEKKALLNDPTMKDISKEVAKLEKQKERLQQLVDKGFPLLGHHLWQLKIAATRNPDFVQLLLRLRHSESGEGGAERQQAFLEHVAPYAKDTLNDDETRLKKFCKTARITCSSDKIREYFKELNKEVTSWKNPYDAVISGVKSGKSIDKLNPDAVLEILPQVTAKVNELGDLIDSWQLKNPLRFNEPLWMTYLNWVEDSESAVRVYLKVTNREYIKDSPSNSLIACAEQRHNLPYQPDRMVRFGDCSAQPPWESEWKSTDKACSSHDAWDDEHQDQTFGPFFGVYASSDAKKKRSMEHNILNEDVYGYQKSAEENFEWAPHMRSVLRQAQSGYTIVLFGYGYSGTGKTYTLLGKGKTPGVMTLGLQEMQDSIKKIQVRFKELYGQISLEDGRPEVGETGLYSYKIATGDDSMPVADVRCPDQSNTDCVEYKFWGRSDAKKDSWEPKDLFVPPKSDLTNPPNYKPKGDEVAHLGFADFLEMPEHTITLNKYKIKEAGHTIGEWLQSALNAIQRTRERQKCREQKGEEGCRHVRATPNNPESSRGHLFTMLDVTFKAHADDKDQTDKIGKIVIVDCAGSEDPVSIMKDYVDFAADGEDPTVGDLRAMRYLKEYDRQLAGKLRLWNSQTNDDVIAKKKKRAWLIEAARVWASKLPADLIAGNPNTGGREGVTWKKFNKGDKFEPFLRRSGSTPEDELLQTWSEKYLLGAGIIAMVKEGVFINESLNHLKQFLLKRSGRIQSLLQIVKPDGLKDISDGDLKVPGTSNPELPLINDWDFDKADAPKYFADGKQNSKYDPVASSYHPKQFIHPWNTRKVGSTNFKPKKDANNSESLLGSSRCSYNWESDTVANNPFSCDSLVVDGVAAQRKHLTVGAIPRFDPVMMTSMLNYFDHPEYFGKKKNVKPTKFLMIAAVRREHPKDDSRVPDDHDAKSFKRLKRNICMGAEMTLTFADEMNPLSKNNRLSVA